MRQTQAHPCVCSQIRENIALGDPTHAHDNDAIERAARLGGATEVISRLPDGFDAYLERPVGDQYSGLPDGTTTLFGRKVDNGYLRGIMDSPADISVSGGEMQRIAVARTFMRSSSSSAEQRVGLLLFDEPSASLDPAAEHGTNSLHHESIISLMRSPFMTRSILSASRDARKQNVDILYASARKPYAARRYHFVSFFCFQLSFALTNL